MIKKSIFILVFVLTNSSFAASTQVRKIHLPSQETVGNSRITVVVPAGWSYLKREFSPAEDLMKIPNKYPTTSSLSLIIDPAGNPEDANTSIYLVDRIPHVKFDAKWTAKTFKDSVLTSENWNGRKWDLVETKETVNSVKSLRWQATIRLKDRDYELSASFPVADQDEFRIKFKKVFESIKIIGE